MRVFIDVNSLAIVARQYLERKSGTIFIYHLHHQQFSQQFPLLKNHSDLALRRQHMLEEISMCDLAISTQGTASRSRRTQVSTTSQCEKKIDYARVPVGRG